MQKQSTLQDTQAYHTYLCIDKCNIKVLHKVYTAMLCSIIAYREAEKEQVHLQPWNGSLQCSMQSQ